MCNLRPLRSLLAVCAVALVAAAPAAACIVTSAHVQGEFNDAGGFVVSGVLDSQGRPVPASGFVCDKITTEENVVMAAGGTSGKVYVVGDVDCDTGSLHVRSYTTDASIAQAAVAKTKFAGNASASCSASKAAAAGAGCSTSKGAAAVSAGAGCSTSKAASAQSASAGAGCSTSKGAAAVSAGAGCSASKAASAHSASAGAGCSTSKGAAAVSAGAGCSTSKAASAQSASAGAGCSTSKGAAAVSAGAGCGADCTKECCAGGAAAKAATAKTADAGSDCGPDCVKACCAAAAAHEVVFNVSGMTCGGCESKVSAAVAALKLEGVSCDVSYEDAKAVLTLADGAEVDADAVAKAISATGFKAELKPAAEKPAEAKEKATDIEEPTSTM